MNNVEKAIKVKNPKLKKTKVLKKNIKLLNKIPTETKKLNNVIDEEVISNESVYESGSNSIITSSKKLANSSKDIVVGGIKKVPKLRNIKTKLKNKNNISNDEENEDFENNDVENDDVIKTKLDIKNVGIKTRDSEITNNDIIGNKKSKNDNKIIKIKTSDKVNKDTDIINPKNDKKRNFKMKKLLKKKNSIVKTRSKKRIFVKLLTAPLKVFKIVSSFLAPSLFVGGVIIFVVIIFICMIGAIVNSVFGIFFSHQGNVSELTLRSAMNDINRQVANRVEEIKNNNTYDTYVIETERTEWKEVIAIYAVKVAKDQEVITFDDEKSRKLKKIFWDANEINYEITDDDFYNEITDEYITQQVLHISIQKKGKDSVINNYLFTPNQKKQLDELLSEEYDELWESIIYGGSNGSQVMANIALLQVGQSGEPFWTWYGYAERVDWSGIFVSWVADRAGYLKSGVIPRFEDCKLGVDFFRASDQWEEPGYKPKVGELIFLDNNMDDIVDHVGIVYDVDINYIYTVECDSNDTCVKGKLPFKSYIIYGFGTPLY